MTWLTHATLAVVSALVCIASVRAEAPKVPPKVEFKLAETKPGDGLTRMRVVGTLRSVYLPKGAALSAEDVASAKVIFDKEMNPQIEVTFTKEGSKKLAAACKAHKNKPLAILIDDKVLCAPTIKAIITEKAVITGKFSRADAEGFVKAVMRD